MWRFTSPGPCRPSLLPGFRCRHCTHITLATTVAAPYLVYEVGCFDGPTGRNVALLDVDLLGEHHVSDVLAGFADVGASTQHELVSDNTNCEVINCIRVILPTHYFGCHVARRPRRVLAVFGLPDFGYSHISDPNVACVLHHEILWLDVAVNHTLSMHIFESTDQTSEHEFGLWLCEPPPFSNMVAEVAACQEVTDEVEVLAVLEREVHVHKESNRGAVVSGEFRLTYGCLSFSSRRRSLMTDWTDRLSRMRAFDISFMA